MKKIEFKYWLFLLVWVMIILPKPIQMGLIIIIVIGCLIKNNFKIKKDKVFYLFLLYSIVHLLSIVVNFLKYENTERVIAALNTCGIWIVSILLYSYYKDTKIDKQKIKKYLAYNLYILIFLFFITIISQKFNISIPTILSRNLYNYEWLNNTMELRFFGFMEYSNLVVYFYFLCFPFAFDYIKEKHSKIFLFCFIVFSALPVIMTNSRLGIFLVLLLMFFAVNNIFNKQTNKVLMILFGLILLFIVVFNFDKIANIIDSVIDSREGSTSMRSAIYSLSISRTIDDSLLIGNGIKEIFNGYPLGSHSTFIGFFYKTGLIGTIVVITAFVLLYIEFYRKLKQEEKVIYLISAFCVLIFMMTEDLDGANWLLALYFSLMGVICNSKKNEGEKNEK